MPDAETVRMSFSFSAEDDAAFRRLLVSLRKEKAVSRPATVLRALIYMTSESDLIARSVRLTATLALSATGEPEIASRPSINTPQDQARKLDDVVLQLSRANITATRTFVVRAMIREAPTGKPLADLVTRFLEEVPFKPRGMSKIRQTRKARD
jgi:hypothetical protein